MNNHLGTQVVGRKVIEEEQLTMAIKTGGEIADEIILLREEARLLAEYIDREEDGSKEEQILLRVNGRIQWELDKKNNTEYEER